MLQNFQDKIGYSVKLKSPSADCSSEFSSPEEPLESNFLHILSQYCNAYVEHLLFLKNTDICNYSHFSLFFFSLHILSCSVQSLSRVRLFATPWTTTCQASLSITNSWSLPKPMNIEPDAIQPSYPLSSPSPPALNLSQHQGLFKWVSSSHWVAKVLVFQLQHQSFQWTPRTDLL